MPDKKNTHILVVEDNPADVYLLRRALEIAQVDCDLTVVEDGAEALALVHGEDKYAGVPVPDLAIIDINLPKHSGVEVLEAMRGSAPFDKVPVLVLSSSSSPRERARIDQFRVERFVPKPPDLDDFLSVGLVVKQLLAETRNYRRASGD